MSKSKLTIVINFYNNEREAPRSLYTLTPEYQGVDKDLYQVIVIDNNSSKPLKKEKVLEISDNFEYHYYESKYPSPCAGMNFGIKKATSPYVMCMIDGAHLLSPGVLRETLRSLDAYNDPVVLTLPLHLGPYMQFYSAFDGYNQEKEDALLQSIPWRDNGYLLYGISNLENYERNFFSPLYESNCFTLRKDKFLSIGGFNEAFVSRGGGLVNLDVFKRLVDDPELDNVTLIGEASFHQYHGGVTTNVVKTEQPLPIFKKEYKEIYGHYYTNTKYVSAYIGEMNQYCRSQIPSQKWKIYQEMANILRAKNKHDAAVEVMIVSKRLNPYRWQLFNQLGNAYLEAGRDAEAEKTFSDAIDLSPASEINQYIGLANLYMKQGKLKKAENLFQQASIIAPKSAQVPIALMHFYFNADDIEEGKRHMESAIRLLDGSKADTASYMLVGNALHKIKESERAVDMFDKCTQVEPNFARAEFRKGIALMSLERFDEAEKALKRALHLDFVEKYQIRFQLAKIYEHRKDYATAMYHCKLAADLKPQALKNTKLQNDLKSKLKSLRDNSNYKSFIFTHIPKSGGMSFRKFFCDIAIRSGLENDEIWSPGINGPSVISNIETLGSLGHVLPQRLVVLADHSHYGVHNDFGLISFQDPFYFTIIREPYDRLISAYYYFCYSRNQFGLQGIHLNNLSDKQLYKVLAKEGHELIRFLGNIRSQDLDSDSITIQDMEKAFDNLVNGYALFGLFEEMELSVKLLKENLPIWMQSTIDLPAMNKGQKDITEIKIDAEIEHKIKTYIHLDIQLYRIAKREFEKRMENNYKEKLGSE